MKQQPRKPPFIALDLLFTFEVIIDFLLILIQWEGRLYNCIGIIIANTMRLLQGQNENLSGKKKEDMSFLSVFIMNC